MNRVLLIIIALAFAASTSSYGKHWKWNLSWNCDPVFESLGLDECSWDWIEFLDQGSFNLYDLIYLGKVFTPKKALDALEMPYPRLNMPGESMEDRMYRLQHLLQENKIQPIDYFEAVKKIEKLYDELSIAKQVLLREKLVFCSRQKFIEDAREDYIVRESLDLSRFSREFDTIEECLESYTDSLKKQQEADRKGSNESPVAKTLRILDVEIPLYLKLVKPEKGMIRIIQYLQIIEHNRMTELSLYRELGLLQKFSKMRYRMPRRT